MIFVSKRANRLTDGSQTYDVAITDVYRGEIVGRVLLHACSEKDADYLAETIRVAVIQYTVDVPAVEEGAL